MAYAQAKQALHDRHGNLDIDIAMYLDPKDYGYEVHYVDVPVFDGAKYTGELDKLGNPVNQKEYDLWVSKLPKVKQLNPFHTHRLHFDPSKVTEDKIKSLMDFHLPNFYEAWKAGKTIRSGWDTNTRTRPTRYDKLESAAAFQVRQSLVLQKVSEFAVVSKSVTLTGGKTFPATTIDVGAGANYYGSSVWAYNTVLDKTNPANDTGILDTFELYGVAGTNLPNCKVGTFTGSSTSWTNHDYASIGTVTAGSKQTFTGLSISVSTNDILGAHAYDGTWEQKIQADSAGRCTKTGDQFDAGTQTYTVNTGFYIAFYATGDTEGWANISKINGIAVGDITKINGIAVGDIAKINGVAV